MTPLNLGVACIVLPPGHGKTTYHKAMPELVEADTLVGYRGTPKLNSLRNDARKTGDWVKYDTHWGALLQQQLIRNPVVVMIPSPEVGDLMGWTRLGAGLLGADQLTKNLLPRGATIDKYTDAYEKVRRMQHHDFSTNDSLKAWIVHLVDGWIKSEKNRRITSECRFQRSFLTSDECFCCKHPDERWDCDGRRGNYTECCCALATEEALDALSE